MEPLFALLGAMDTGTDPMALTPWLAVRAELERASLERESQRPAQGLSEFPECVWGRETFLGLLKIPGIPSGTSGLCVHVLGTLPSAAPLPGFGGGRPSTGEAPRTGWLPQTPGRGRGPGAQLLAPAPPASLHSAQQRPGVRPGDPPGAWLTQPAEQRLEGGPRLLSPCRTEGVPGQGQPAPGAHHVSRSQHPQPPPVVPPASLPRGSLTPPSTSYAALGSSPDLAGIEGTQTPLDPRSAHMGTAASRAALETDLGWGAGRQPPALGARGGAAHSQWSGVC